VATWVLSVQRAISSFADEPRRIRTAVASISFQSRPHARRRSTLVRRLRSQARDHRRSRQAALQCDEGALPEIPWKQTAGMRNRLTHDLLRCGSRTGLASRGAWFAGVESGRPGVPLRDPDNIERWPV